MTYTKTAHPQNAEQAQGFAPTEVAKTLNCHTTPDSEIRAEELVLSYEHHPQDSRVKETDVSPTCGTFGNSIEGKDCIVQSIAIAENIIGRQVENGGNGVGAQEELAYTQNATGVMGVACVPIDLRNAMRDPNKKDEVNRQGVGVGDVDDPMYPLTTSFVPGVSINCQGGSGVNIQEEATETITAATNSSGNNVLAVCTKGNGDAFVSDVHTSLSASGGGQAGQGYPACLTTSTVRRLLPVECERLMGFPDNHTRIEWNGKPAEECPDAPRYKACGNSMCVNCMEWIGRRIDAIHKIYHGEKK